MTQQEITAGNKLIMLFDGWVKRTFQTFDPDHNGGKNDYTAFVKLLDGTEIARCREEDIAYDIVYHKSWDALMQVVDKIEALGYRVCIEEKACVIFKQFGLPLCATTNYATKIDATWDCVKNFIEWRNKTY